MTRAKDNQKWMQIPPISEILTNSEQLTKYSFILAAVSFVCLQLLFIVEIIIKTTMYLSGIIFVFNLASGRATINFSL